MSEKRWNKIKPLLPPLNQKKPGNSRRWEKKYSQAFSFKNTARLIFSANKIPAVRDDTRACFRGLILIKFPNVFEGGKEDKNLLSKLTTEEELNGFLNFALKIQKSFKSPLIDPSIVIYAKNYT